MQRSASSKLTTFVSKKLSYTVLLSYTLLYIYIYFSYTETLDWPHIIHLDLQVKWQMISILLHSIQPSRFYVLYV